MTTLDFTTRFLPGAFCLFSFRVVFYFSVHFPGSPCSGVHLPLPRLGGEQAERGGEGGLGGQPRHPEVGYIHPLTSVLIHIEGL